MDLACGNRMDARARTQQASSNDEEVKTRQSLPIEEQIPGGRYHLVERLSAGAIGAVYKALDTVLDRPVAVKCVRLDTPFADHGPDEVRERFVREARIAARLQHASIVTIHDIVATPDRGFIIMEFIEGQSLESVLASRPRLELSTSIRVISQLASALDYAHERNVVHRDVKPSNILVSDSYDVWVTDFGIAKSELSTNLTMAGGVLGTPDYMSPEQAKGEDVDCRTDLFSLGCILFECVVGRKPFSSQSLTGVLLSIINDEPLFPSNWKGLGLPNGLKPILNHALEKDRERRYPTGSALVSALHSIPREDIVQADETARNPIVETDERPATNERVEEPKAEEAPTAKAEEVPETEEVTKAQQPPEAEEPSRVEETTNAEASAPEQAEAEASTSEQPEAKEPVADSPEPPPLSSEKIQALKEESRPLRLASTLSADLQNVEISPEEGFLLSRIDGSSRAHEILTLSPMSEADSARALMELLDKGLIHWGGSAKSEVARPKATPRPKAKPKGAIDGQVLAELERLLSLAAEGDFAGVLGVEPGAPESERKASYRKLVGKFHPDKFPKSDEAIHAKLSRLCAAASEALTELDKPVEKPSVSTATGSHARSASAAFESGSDDTAFDKRRYARELYDRGLRAFDTHDFWDAIQLARQAIEVDDGEAEFFALLGRALMQNKKWRKEAADNFRRASDLAPNNVEYLGMLGAIYQAVGLATRAQSVLEKAREIDPDYELPELEPEPTFSD
jgi:serine/threonine protein kinase